MYSFIHSSGARLSTRFLYRVFSASADDSVLRAASLVPNAVLSQEKKWPMGRTKNIQLRLTSVDADTDFVDVDSIHRVSYLCLAIRARGPHDYSSYA